MRFGYLPSRQPREERRAVLANCSSLLMGEKRELNLLDLPELPRESLRRRRRRRTVRVTVVMVLLVTGIIALLVTRIIAYWASSDRLRGNNSSSPPAASKSRDAGPQSLRYANMLQQR